ncbi:hypothetical protein ABZW02_25765 [Streptomyces sp. NPDC005180]|uniref:hypothetical protein n=1 Tax=Streptomyces sp. NPDC005180 TaxID=3156868 RepID=UPI0033B92BFE
MTEVLVEEATLDDGIVMIYKRYEVRVRMAFDRTRISQDDALALLCQRIPEAGGMKVVLRAAS